MLYILATPLGNLEDLSDRAKRILSEAGLIIAENPAYSKRLLDHLGIKDKKMVQFAEHNEQEALPKIIGQIRNTDAVLLSDAGTPGISDPGFRLVRQAVKEGVAVSPIPGPNAAISALCASGLPTDKFIFLGFVPKTEVKLTRELQSAKDIQATAVFYESPHRILKTISYIAKAWPEASVVIARELTKIHEEFIRGTAEEVLAELERRTSIKGEITVIISFK